MIKRRFWFELFFDRVILQHPRWVLLGVLAVVGFCLIQARHFRLDASAETLVQENDQDLKYARQISARYGSRDFLVLTYTPRDDLFSDKTLAALEQLNNDLTGLDHVVSVLSILDVPLLASPPISIQELRHGIHTLLSGDVDRDLARQEFRDSPLYSQLLVSSDLKTTALLIYFADDPHYQDLLEKRDQLREQKAAGPFTPTQEAALDRVSGQFRRRHDALRQQRHEDIAAIRSIMERYRGDADLFLGGVSMIADDMISYVRHDLKVFGLGVLVFLILTLGVIFRGLRWIFIPLLICLVSAMCMIGLLGWFRWEVTVISSNFISLQLIITMAVVIHLIVRYRELYRQYPDAENRYLISETVRHKLKPCLYAALTTIAGFGSLVLCDILPVITFGWMMITGLVVSLIVAFILFPAVLVLFPEEHVTVTRTSPFSLTAWLANITQSYGAWAVVLGVLGLVFSVLGVRRLQVENCFIDYFKSDTEIYQGMKVIDRQLGGTTPLDLIVEFEKPQAEASPAIELDADPDESVFDEFSEFAEATTDETYWFTPEKMALISRIHDYLESLPEIGKVLSLATTLRVAEGLKQDGQSLDSFDLALLFNETPEPLKEILIYPYVSVEHSEVRFSVRVRDSEKTLRRNELLNNIRQTLTGAMGLAKDRVHLSGMLVLYNNMLQSLFRSQILTLGITVGALLMMFLILFRSLGLSLIALFPNLLSIGIVLGMMGWLGIPLDMMTITIAAISVGIAVDDTIHYIHRFQQELAADGDYLAAMHRSHRSIGHAMYYTSVTIIIGFSILVMSDFIPTIYFGLLTSLAMFIALLCALTLLPQLIILFKPFEKPYREPRHTEENGPKGS